MALHTDLPIFKVAYDLLDVIVGLVRNMPRDIKGVIGGEIPEFTKLLAQSRNEAMARMVAEATRRGSNAIVGMRFDSGAIGQWSEICAYGTGVWISPITDVARQQYDALVASGQLPHQDTYELRVSEWTRTETGPGSPPR